MNLDLRLSGLLATLRSEHAGLCPPPMEEGGATPHPTPTKAGCARQPRLVVVGVVALELQDAFSPGNPFS